MDDFWIFKSEKNTELERHHCKCTGHLLLIYYIPARTFLLSLIIIIAYSGGVCLMMHSREYLNMLWRSKEDGDKTLMMLFVYLLTEIRGFIRWYKDTIFKGRKISYFQNVSDGLCKPHMVIGLYPVKDLGFGDHTWLAE